MASPAYRTHSLTAYASSGTSDVVDKPTGTAENDILIWFLYTEHTALETITFPGDWNIIQRDINLTTPGKEVQMTIAWKVAGASEGTTYTANWTNTKGNKSVMVAVSGAYTADPIDDSALNKMSGSGTGVTLPSLTAGATDTLYVGAPTGWDGTPDWSFTELTLRQADGVIGLGTQAIAASGATGTKAATNSVTQSGRIGCGVLVASQASGGAVAGNAVPLLMEMRRARSAI